MTRGDIISALDEIMHDLDCGEEDIGDYVLRKMEANGLTVRRSRGGAIKLSWNRDETGTISVYATWPNGRMAPVADVWLQALINAGIDRGEASRLQEVIAERLCESLIDEAPT